MHQSLYPVSSIRKGCLPDMAFQCIGDSLMLQGATLNFVRSFGHLIAESIPSSQGSRSGGLRTRRTFCIPLPITRQRRIMKLCDTTSTRLLFSRSCVPFSTGSWNGWRKINSWGYISSGPTQSLVSVGQGQRRFSHHVLRIAICFAAPHSK